MKSKWILVLLVMLGFITPVQAARWIALNPQVSPATLAQVKVVDQMQFQKNNFVVFTTKDTVRSATIHQRVQQLQAVLQAEKVMPDFEVRLLDTSAPQIIDARMQPGSLAWHVDSMKYADLPAQFNGQGQVVAVLDSGVLVDHIALAPHIWVNPNEVAGNNIDDDGNGYVDDVNGWDFVENKGAITDSMGHGTHCAGIIAASRDENTNAQGVAQEAKIMAVRIFGGSGDTRTFLSQVSRAIRYAADSGATVMSNSWRLYKSWNSYAPTPENIALLSAAIQYAGEKGAIFVAAAGNESNNIDTDTNEIYPAGMTGLANLYVVAASDSNARPASFTNFGVNKVHVAAPGVDIISTYRSGWAAMSGTSMATPLVAGALARGLSAGMSPADAMTRMQDISDKTTVWQNKVKSGLINLLAYLSL